MKNQNTKKLTPDIIFFIGDLAEKYHIEKFEVKDNPTLTEKLSKAVSFSEKMTLMLLYDKTVNEYEKTHKPLEDLFPSFKINKIVEDLINKKIAIDDLRPLLQKNVAIDPSIINYLVKEIADNQNIKDLIDNKELPTVEEKEEQVHDVPSKSIGYELMK